MIKETSTTLGVTNNSGALNLSNNFKPVPFSIIFSGSNSVKQMGRFFENEDGLFDFEGDCTESAKVFVKEIKRLLNK